MTDKFVEEHKEEIERKAFCLYQDRVKRYRQDDAPVDFFLRAIAIVKEQYGIPDRYNRL